MYDQIKNKTLWDWMELLIVPATLAIGAFILGQWQADNENERNLDNQRQVMLDSFIDKMSELLLEKDLRKSENSESQSVARTRSLSLFRQLDGDRKGNALQFLYESRLINHDDRVINILGLDLDQASLSGASLIGVDLAGSLCTNAHLQNAIFENSSLTGCVFSHSELQRADFTNASLDQAILSHCNLVDANFTGADLYMADFTGASVTLEQLKKSKSLDYAILPDGSVFYQNSKTKD